MIEKFGSIATVRSANSCTAGESAPSADVHDNEARFMTCSPRHRVPRGWSPTTLPHPSDRQTGLASTANSGDRDQTMLGQQSSSPIQVVDAANQTGWTHRQIQRRRVVNNTQRSECTLADLQQQHWFVHVASPMHAKVVGFDTRCGTHCIGHQRLASFTSRYPAAVSGPARAEHGIHADVRGRQVMRSSARRRRRTGSGVRV